MMSRIFFVGYFTILYWIDRHKAINIQIFIVHSTTKRLDKKLRRISPLKVRYLLPIFEKAILLNDFG